jgi:hypothetical protein
MNMARKEGFPQVLMRMGYGKNVKPTPRRQVERPNPAMIEFIREE